MQSRKEAINTFVLVVLYGVCFHLLQYFLFQRDMVRTLTSEDMLLTWDSGWYLSIVEKGYEFHEGASNTAFYYLFPLIWKVLHLNGWGVSFLNILFLAAGVTIFTRIYKLSAADKLLLLTIPSFYFCFIPYTESLFFLLSSLVLFAIHRRQKYLLWVSLFLVSQVRPVAMIFIPAFLITELITHERSEWLKAVKNFLVLYGIPLVIGTAFFIWYQYHETGVWFAFFKQEKNWGHEFAWPSLPFDNNNGPKLLWIDALSMFTGFVCLLLLLWKGIQWLFKNRVQQDRLLIVSYLYITAILFITALFNPIWGNYRTNIYDNHRYAFVTPFFWVFMYEFTQRRVYKWKDFLMILFLSNAFWLLFGSYAHIQFLFYLNFNTLLIFLYMLYADKERTWPPLAITGINLFIQVQMFQFFIWGIYPG